MSNNEIPRRIDMDRWTPAEHAIHHAMVVVEEAGAHPLLTEAVMLLEKARAKVADFVELPSEPASIPRAIAIHRIEVEVEQVHEVQFVVIEDGKLIARVGVKCRGLSIATFRQLYVVPECRKRGIGKELVMACICEALEAGCGVINLTVAANNRSVIPWYNAQGFCPALEYEDGEVVLMKRIQ